MNIPPPDENGPSHRREFLQSCLSACAGLGFWGSLGVRAAASGNLPIEEPEPFSIVDTHVHLWSRKNFTLKWIQNRSELDRDFTLDDYRRETEGLGVSRAVYMEVDAGLDNLEREAELVLRWCEDKQSPLAGAVIGGRPADEGFQKYLDRFRGRQALKGVRQVLHGSAPPGFCVTPEFLRGAAALGDRGLSFDLCVRPGELSDAEKLCRSCPGTSFILDHCGNAQVFWDKPSMDRWRDDIKRIALRENLCCKVSGIVASTRERPWSPENLAPIIDCVMDSFGEDRVLFGGDWPVCTLGASLRAWVEALRQVVSKCSPGAQKKLFAANALRVYRLS